MVEINIQKVKFILIFISILLFYNCKTISIPMDIDTNSIYFLSDSQQPMLVERLYLRSNMNIQSRDSLLRDILSRKPNNIFLLGDMTSFGSHIKKWLPIEQFIQGLLDIKTNIYAIPGNHEYFGFASKGITKFQNIFSNSPLFGFVVITDSVAVLMLNSNFRKADEDSFTKQLTWYKQTMDQMEDNNLVKIIIVCTHHPPFTNSKLVSPSVRIKNDYLPSFEKSTKTKLFISGHSHNLEVFKSLSGKHYIVAGGGGGLTHPLLKYPKSLYTDIIAQDTKPIFFYLIVNRKGESLSVKARGLFNDFTALRELEIGDF